MSTQRTINALETLLDHSKKDAGKTAFFLASRGPLQRTAEKTVFCVSSDPVFTSILLTLKDGMDELKQDKGTTLTRKDIVNKMRDQLNVAQTLLQCEELSCSI